MAILRADARITEIETSTAGIVSLLGIKQSFDGVLWGNLFVSRLGFAEGDVAVADFGVPCSLEAENEGAGSAFGKRKKFLPFRARKARILDLRLEVERAVLNVLGGLEELGSFRCGPPRKPKGRVFPLKPRLVFKAKPKSVLVSAVRETGLDSAVLRLSFAGLSALFAGDVSKSGVFQWFFWGGGA